VPPPGPLVHLFCLTQLASVLVEVAHVVDRVQRRRVSKSECLLLPSQGPLVNLLCVAQLALVPVEKAQQMHSIEHGASLFVYVYVFTTTSLSSPTPNCLALNYLPRARLRV
jgi:hypothetical protein